MCSGLPAADAGGRRTGWQQTLRSSMARLLRLGRFLAPMPASSVPICTLSLLHETGAISAYISATCT